MFYVCGRCYVCGWFYVCGEIGFMSVGNFYVCGWFTFVVVTGFLSNEPVLASVKDQTPSGLFFRRFSPGKTCVSLEEPVSG